MPAHFMQNLKEAWEVPRDLLLRRYPPFVTGGPLSRGDIPVFVLHGAEPRPLGRQLQYLSDNGYRTLGADEYIGILLGGRPAPDRAVLLTFDDGRASLWSVAQPLLHRFGMRAVVFLIPGRMRSRPGPLRATWAEVESGRIDAAAVLCREDGPGALLSWEEVERLSKTDLFDFQCHTLTHARIHVGPEVEGFVTPWSRRGYAALDQPLIHDGERDLLGEDAPLGTPLLRSAPRTSEELRFYEDPEFRDGCVNEAARGGEDFFLRPDWEKTLQGRISGQRPRGRVETPEQRARAIEKELVESKRLIEEHTNRPVSQLCYPWHAFGPTAQALAREAGYRAAFCGKVPGVPITRSGGDLQRIARIGEDYIELLPGRGRGTLRGILRRKWARRFGRSA
ncbi:MAG: polysaccharide deacetylase family protein [Acidobacteria bacterium]|nr:polysaccharide deacetylase family protein [Acidobacteriota bacterium]